MNSNDKWRDQIDRYIQQKLTKEEQSLFEKELHANPELADELALRQELNAGIKTLGNRDLKQRLKTMHKEVEQEQTNKLRLPLWKMLGAAAAVLLCCVFLFYFFQSKDLTTQELFANYYQTFELNLQDRGDATNKQLEEAIDFYDAKKYNQAFPIFETILSTDSANPQIQLAAGICQLEANQTTPAIERFQKVYESNDPFFKDHATWYLALCYLRQNDLGNSRRFLTQLANDVNVDHHQEAVELLTHLKE